MKFIFLCSVFTVTASLSLIGCGSKQNTPLPAPGPTATSSTPTTAPAQTPIVQGTQPAGQTSWSCSFQTFPVGSPPVNVTGTCGSSASAAPPGAVNCQLPSSSTGSGTIGWCLATAGASPAPSVTSSAGTPNFGPNVLIFDPSMPAATIQSKLDAVFAQQQSSQFGAGRYAIFFKPGTYNANVNVGFYTQVAGLGQTPDSVVINGSVQASAAWNGGNATVNFWRSAENLAVVPTGGTMTWAVSQGVSLRRLHVKGSLALSQSGWSSGGFIADSIIDGQVRTGSQQQWFARNSQWASWSGALWNMVFLGDINAPGNTFPKPPNTTVGQTPTVREKPFLSLDAAGNYGVFVPGLRSNSQGTSWPGGTAAGQFLPMSSFYIAQAGTDTATTMNAALAQGKNLLLTPGVYTLSSPMQVAKPNTVVLGLGLATLIPSAGTAAITTTDVDGIAISGLIVQAGTPNSPVLIQVGPQGSMASHAADPISLSDIYVRIGGAAPGSATVSLQINSGNVIGDNFWMWRADHGAGAGWTSNTAANGLVVNGANVSVYGLAVEHYQQFQTLWNGNGGQTYFYQSEEPYDPPTQAAWMNGTENGYPSYKVADTVTSHQAWGLGVYCLFNINTAVKLENAIEGPAAGLNGQMFHDMTSVSLGGVGEITHILDGQGAAANKAAQVQALTQ